MQHREQLSDPGEGGSRVAVSAPLLHPTRHGEPHCQLLQADSQQAIVRACNKGVLRQNLASHNIYVNKHSITKCKSFQTKVFQNVIVPKCKRHKT
jgi:hypothetical protein